MSVQVLSYTSQFQRRSPSSLVDTYATSMLHAGAAKNGAWCTSGRIRPRQTRLIAVRTVQQYVC